NSHIQGTNAVGAMIVAGPDGFQKNQYRKFNIRSAELAPGDDFAMMREVLGRRFKRLMAEAPRAAAASDQPVEGGAAQGVYEHPSPALASLGHPQAERVTEQAASESNIDDVEGAEFGAHLEPESDEHEESPWPDLVIIDGGRGQLTAAQEALTALGITDVPLAAV